VRAYASASITVYCRGCGNPRVLTRRQARRAGLCNACLYPPREPLVHDRYRRFWFEKFTDHELSVLASELAGRWVPVARIAERRSALIASGSLRGPDGLSSDSERQADSLLSPPR
jgi:hypothetical protein